jgi:hypothetical protein
VAPAWVREIVSAPGRQSGRAQEERGGVESGVRAPPPGVSARFVSSGSRGRRPVERLGVVDHSSDRSVPSASSVFGAWGRGPGRPGVRPTSGSSPPRAAARRVFVIEADRDLLDEVAGHLALPPAVSPRGSRVGGPPTLRSIRPKRAGPIWSDGNPGRQDTVRTSLGRCPRWEAGLRRMGMWQLDGDRP